MNQISPPQPVHGNPEGRFLSSPGKPLSQHISDLRQGQAEAAVKDTESRHAPNQAERKTFDADAALARIMTDARASTPSTRPVTVAPLDDQLPTGPVHRSIIVLDLEGSTMRTNLVKGELRRVMYDLLEHSLEAVAITGHRLESLTDRGDGVLALVRPHDEVPKTVLFERFIPLLTDLVAGYNAQAEQPALQMRLRAVVHAGEVHMDNRGCYGAAIDVAVRLLDAPQLKKALKQAAAPLVLAVSEEIHSGIISHGYVDASKYFPISVRVGTRRHRGWVRLGHSRYGPPLPEYG